MEHLLNCHGELAFIGSLLSSLPFLGQWYRMRSACKSKKQ